MSTKSFFDAHTSAQLQAMHDAGTFEAEMRSHNMKHAKDFGTGSPIESNTRTVALKPGQHVEDVYILLPRERDTIIAALRLWQDRDIKKVAGDWGRFEALQDIATNGDKHDALDENEIDIMIEDKLNI